MVVLIVKVEVQTNLCLLPCRSSVDRNVRVLL